MQTRFDHGFTLIEVLVAVLVLAVGIVGAGAAQVAALKTRHGTELMSAGVQLAASLAERMRANPVPMRLDDSANPYLLQYDAAADGAPPAPPALCFAGTSCDSAQLAAFDGFEIRQAVFQRFPGARIAVCRDSTVWHGRALAWQCAGGPGAPLVVKLGWRGAREKAGTPLAPSLAVLVAGAST